MSVFSSKRLQSLERVLLLWINSQLSATCYVSENKQINKLIAQKAL